MSVYHSLWSEKTPARAGTTQNEANKRLFSKNSKKIIKKYMKVVTNGVLWCILTVGLGKLYPYDSVDSVSAVANWLEEECVC